MTAPDRFRRPPRAPEDVACREVVELITAYLEDTLPPEEAEEVRSHLEICPGCQTYLDQMRATIAVLGEVPVETLCGQAQADLIAAFRDYPRGTGAR